MGRRVDNRDNISYKVRRPEVDLWPIVGTLLLVLFVFTFATIVWQGRHALHPGSHKTPTDRIALIAASPQPTRANEPTPEPTPTPSPSPSAQLVDTGATQPNSQAPRPPPTARPTPAPKPTATHQPPTAILNVTPYSGPVTMSFAANASLSWDATGIASYQFIWGDGLSDPPQSSAWSQPHKYSVAKQYTITVIVVNKVGFASSQSTTVTVY